MCWRDSITPVTLSITLDLQALYYQSIMILFPMPREHCYSFPMSKPFKPQSTDQRSDAGIQPKSKPLTREEILREWLVLQKFTIVKNGEPIADGVIIQVIDTEVIMVDMWRNGERDESTVHYFAFKELKWDEFTKTGFMFGPMPERD